eukprot:Pgem_evm1s9755
MNHKLENFEQEKYATEKKNEDLQNDLAANEEIILELENKIKIFKTENEALSNSLSESASQLER